jgi:hypothetical protein
MKTFNHHFDQATAHDREIFNKFCKTSEYFDPTSLLDIIIESYMDDQDIEGLTNYLQEIININSTTNENQ